MKEKREGNILLTKEILTQSPCKNDFTYSRWRWLVKYWELLYKWPSCTESNFYVTKVVLVGMIYVELEYIYIYIYKRILWARIYTIAWDKWGITELMSTLFLLNVAFLKLFYLQQRLWWLIACNLRQEKPQWQRRWISTRYFYLVIYFFDRSLLSRELSTGSFAVKGSSNKRKWLKIVNREIECIKWKCSFTETI